MLKRSSSLRQTSSLKSASQLKNSTTLKAKSNLTSSGGGLRSYSTLRQGESKLKTNSYKRTKTSSTGGYAAMPKRNVQNQAVIDQCCRPTCEICSNPCGGEPHHIISRGAGGADIPENLIQLCGHCHRAVHSGRLAEERLLWAVAHRYMTTPTAIRNIIEAASSHY